MPCVPGCPHHHSHVADIQVHIDTLDYTREGLKSSDPIPLQVGSHNRVVLIRPSRARPIGDGRGGFPHDSSFPLPATLSVLWHFRTPHSVFRHLPHGETVSATDRVFQLYAHATASGDDDYNKGLTDRRAAVALSLLRADVDAFQAELAASGYESLEYQQAMLRVLGCDPGPIDGEPGDLTEQATSLFQRRYQAGDFHRHTPAEPAHPDPFPEPGALDDTTSAALVEAFVVANGGHVPEAAMHPTHPAQGCSEFNQLTDDDFAQRRLTLIDHAFVPEYSERAPCTTDDAGACAVVDDEPFRCMWYREHVYGRTDVYTPSFYDPRWLALTNGRFLLTALTTLPDDAPVTFRVFDTTDGIELGEPLSVELCGVVKLGVAMVVWAPDGGVPGEPPVAPHRAAFKVCDADARAEAIKPWPLTSPARLLIDTAHDEHEDLELRFRLRSTDGAFEQELHISEATPYSAHYVQLEFTDVPVESRFILEYDEAGGTEFDGVYFEDVVLHGLAGRCSGGTQCTEPDAPPSPPGSAPTPADEDDAEDGLTPADDGYGIERDPEA